MSRARPEHVAKKLACKECGASLDLRDERTRMLVCSYCGSVLELTATEQRVLQRRQGLVGAPPYRVDLGERVSLDGASYEVIARVCVIEESPAYQTHQYYLYHPRREPRWLSEYKGSWSTSSRTRVRPTEDVFDPATRHAETYDGRSWSFVERGVTEVYHVDGALPYVQRVGDTSEYVALEGADDRSLLYEASRSADEIEYGQGRSLSQLEVERALGRSLAPLAGSSGAPVGRTDALSPYYAALFGAVVVGAIGLVVYGWQQNGSGAAVGAYTAGPEGMRQNALSPPFHLDDEDVVRVSLRAPLDNAWMYAQVALVEEDGDTVVHVSDTEFGYYTGSDSEGRWTEGSQSSSVFFGVEDAGRYRLLLGGLSGFGEAPSDRINHPLTASIYRGASYRLAAYLGAGACVVFGLFGLLALVVVGSSSRGDTDRLRRRGRLVTGGAIAGLAVICAASLWGCASSFGLPEMEHPEGISIRQSSVQDRPGVPFLAVYSSPRAHLGGGVHTGK